MSSTRVNNKRTFSKFSQPEQKKFCGVCQKAGKSEKEYTSHFTRSVPGPKGIIVCPTILCAECSFCHQKGHWASEDFCPALKDKKRLQKEEEKNYANRRSYVSDEKTEKTASYGRYAAFNEPEIMKEQQQKPIVEEFPALGNPTSKPKAIPTYASYASIIAQKEAPIRQEEPSEFTTFLVLGKATKDAKTVSKRCIEDNYEDDNYEDDNYEDDNYEDDDDSEDEYCAAWNRAKRSAKSSF